MANPQAEPQPLPAPIARPNPAPLSHLWSDAPGWRMLFLSALILTLVPVSYLLTAYTGQIGEDEQPIPPSTGDAGCYVSPAPVQFQTIRGVVVGFLPREQAILMMKRTQAQMQREINLNYVTQQRVKVHVDGSPEGSWLTVLLPEGMITKPGDQIDYRRSHGDPDNGCRYIPNLITRIDPA